MVFRFLFTTVETTTPLAELANISGMQRSAEDKTKQMAITV
jgi:hypothetical protein